MNIARRPNVGTAELLRFFTDREQFPELDAHGVAVVSALLLHVNTSGKRGTRYQAYPSHRTLARFARVSEPTARRWVNHLATTGYVLVTKRRAGKRNGANLYDVSPAVERILLERKGSQPTLAVVRGGGHDT